jgi:RNA polymerase sigma-70 factor (ECF subfamily)
MRLLELSASGSELTTYHLEAAMASVHAMARHTEDTNWGTIIGLYDQLIRLNPSPIVALNRAIAIAQRDGPERGIAEIQAIPDPDRLSAYPFYPAALGELEFRCGNQARAQEHFEVALARARNPMERHFFEHRLAACRANNRQPAPVNPFWEPQFASAQAPDGAED